MFLYRGINLEDPNELITQRLNVKNKKRGISEINKMGPTFVVEDIYTAANIYALNKEGENNWQVLLRVEINENNFLVWQPYLHRVKIQPRNGMYTALPSVQGDAPIILLDADIYPIESFDQLQGEIQIEIHRLPEDLLNSIELAYLTEGRINQKDYDLNFIRFEEFRQPPPDVVRI